MALKVLNVFKTASKSTTNLTHYRQMKGKQPFTYPALLDEMWVWLALLETMEAFSPQQINRFKKTFRQFV